MLASCSNLRALDADAGEIYDTRSRDIAWMYVLGRDFQGQTRGKLIEIYAEIYYRLRLLISTD